nr:hypothetical protein [Tanacetum cinerariifolium]
FPSVILLLFARKLILAISVTDLEQRMD